MTTQEAIRRIKDHCKVHFLKEKSKCPFITKALEMAISALEYRTAKKATDIYDENSSEKFDCNGKLNPFYEKALFGCCPQCRFEVQDKMNFCFNCGQALDWI